MPHAESALRDDLAFLLARASARASSSGSAALQPFGLTVRAYAALALAVERQGITQREVAEFLALDPSRVVALVDELQSKGLVGRIPAPSDRRVNLVTATDAGREVFARAAAAVGDAQHALFSRLGPADWTAAVAFLRSLAFADDLD